MKKGKLDSTLSITLEEIQLKSSKNLPDQIVCLGKDGTIGWKPLAQCTIEDIYRAPDAFDQAIRFLIEENNRTIELWQNIFSNRESTPKTLQ